MLFTPLGHFRFFSSKSSISVANLALKIISSDRPSLSQAITKLESTLTTHQEESAALFKELSTRGPIPKNTLRVGFSGSPGVGKSTFIESLGLKLVNDLNLKLAVLTVDPSSLRSGGSILGDKTRMQNLAFHPNAFIRSSPNSGDSGGVIASTFDTIRLCEYANFNVVFVETVGVGQSELAVADLVDIFVLLVAPGVGDELQGIKKGITEMADLILVNKTDDPMNTEANQTLFEYRSAMKFSLYQSIPKKVLPVSGKTGRGITEAWEEIQSIHKNLEKTLTMKREKQREKWCEYVARMKILSEFHQYYQENHFNIDRNTTLMKAAIEIKNKWRRIKK